MHQVFSLSWHLEQYINVICVILFCQCDFTQLWGNQPTKIGRKALCIRIKINKFKKQYIQWVKLQILSPSVFQKIKKKRREKKRKIIQTSKLTLKAQNNLVDTCCQKPPSVNSVLKQLHSPTHISSEGLLQYSIGNYTSTTSSKSSFTGPKVSPRLHYLADLVNKNQNFILAHYDHRQLAHSTWKCSNFLYTHDLAAKYVIILS